MFQDRGSSTKFRTAHALSNWWLIRSLLNINHLTAWPDAICTSFVLLLYAFSIVKSLHVDVYHHLVQVLLLIYESLPLSCVQIQINQPNASTLKQLFRPTEGKKKTRGTFWTVYISKLARNWSIDFNLTKQKATFWT